MKYVVRTIVALGLAAGCIRERGRGARDAGATEALRPNPGREVPMPGAKPDASARAVAAAPAPEGPSIEERLRRCDPSVRGAVVRVSDELAYATESTPAGPVIRLVRPAGGEFVCERYEVPAWAPRLALPSARVTLATAGVGAVGSGATVLAEVSGDGVVSAMAVVQGACVAGSTLRPVRLFPSGPSLQLRCWIASQGFWTAVDHLFHRDAAGFLPLISSESGRVARASTAATLPVNPTLAGSIRVAETGASPRLEVATSSVDDRSGATKFTRVEMRWNDAERRFEPTGEVAIGQPPAR